MHTITMEYFITTSQRRQKYRGEIILTFKDEDYKFGIEALSNPTSPKSSSYIYSVKKCEEIKISPSKEKELIRDGNRCLYKLFLSIDIEFANYLDKIEKDFLARTINKFTVTDNINLININLSDDEISLITQSKENRTKLFSSSLLLFLDEFIDKWGIEIENKGDEINFQNILKDYQMLIPILFGFQGEASFESYHNEGSKNKFDIEGDDWIIELKKPTTRLFSSQSSRNNIQGISSEFIGADNQLDLYIKKKNRENPLESSFTRGLLIIGNSAVFDTKEKIFAFLNMCEKSQSNIITFTEVLEKAKILKQNISE